jgi:hypothetical protein
MATDVGAMAEARGSCRARNIGLATIARFTMNHPQRGSSRASRVLDLGRPAGAIGPILPLGHDALKTKLAGMLELRLLASAHSTKQAPIYIQTSIVNPPSMYRDQSPARKERACPSRSVSKRLLLESFPE